MKPYLPVIDRDKFLITFHNSGKNREYYHPIKDNHWEYIEPLYKWGDMNYVNIINTGHMLRINNEREGIIILWDGNPFNL